MSGNTLAPVGGTNGSTLRSSVFGAASGELLEFEFNFVTSDGSDFADYAWARLLDSNLNQVALLFTARTTPNGNSVPGAGMPPIAATIDPTTVTIIANATNWAPLGDNSGACFDTGCGYTDWVNSKYLIQAAGNYILEFGVANWSDTSWQTGLAFDGLKIGGKPLEDAAALPEPLSSGLVALGVAAMLATRRRVRKTAA
jgi:hypothetical protein